MRLFRKVDTPLNFGINKLTKEAWGADKSGWVLLNLQRAPYGYEESSFNAVNICYAHLMKAIIKILMSLEEFFL